MEHIIIIFYQLTDYYNNWSGRVIYFCFIHVFKFALYLRVFGSFYLIVPILYFVFLVILSKSTKKLKSSSPNCLVKRKYRYGKLIKLNVNVI